MLKASSLDLRFRTHHGLGRVLSESLACCNQFRYSSALSPVVRCASNAERKRHPAPAQCEEGLKDGRVTSLAYSCPSTGKLRRRIKNAKFGPLKRRIVEASVQIGTPYSSTLQALQKRLVAQTGRAQLYHPQNVSAQYHPKNLTNSKLEVSLREKTTDTRYIGQRIPAGDEKDVQQTIYTSSSAAGKARSGRGVDVVAREGTARRKGRLARESPGLVAAMQHPPLQNVDPEDASAEVDDVGEVTYVLGLQNVIWTTKSTEEAWDAYQSLLNLEREVSRKESSDGPPQMVLSLALLTQLSRTLSRAKPRTRQLFLRYLSLLARIRQGSPSRSIYTWEWNTLVNLAGSGFRKPPLDLYNAALDIYHDFVRASSSTPSAEKSETKAVASDSPQYKVQPDIYTYTTLLSIALRTRHASAARHASALLNASNSKLSRVTYLMLARCRVETEGLSGVRDGLQTLVREGHEIGVDGVNTFLWAAGKEGQIESALKVYYVLRQHVDTIQCVKDADDERSDNPKLLTGNNQSGPYASGEASEMSIDTSNDTPGQFKQSPAISIPSIGNPSLIEGLTISNSVIPDEITYTTMIQVLAYHGYLIEAMRIFTDMLSTPKDLPDGEEEFQPTDAVFRALFLAYARHGNQIRPDSDVKLKLGLYTPEAEWNLERLQMLLDAFISMPDGSVKPRARVIYWVMVAMERCTGYDHQQCREVWLRLKGRFAFHLDGRMAKLDAKYGQFE